MILNGKKVRDILAERIQVNLQKFKVQPKLVIIQIGNNPASSVYIEQKKKFGEKFGFLIEHVHVKENISEKSIVLKIKKLNSDTKVHGIIVQLPLPKNINPRKIIEAIDPKKDVDGLHSQNLTKLMTSDASGFLPATTKGILSLLDFYKIPIAGKKVTVVGRSLLVGAPTALAFLNRDATVTICHSKTKHLQEEVKRADIVVVAIGRAKFIKKSFVRKGQIIIDVGINRIDGKIFGDVDFVPVSEIVKAITPVPGGVGPMTVASLFQNVLLAYKRHRKNML